MIKIFSIIIWIFCFQILILKLPIEAKQIIPQEDYIKYGSVLKTEDQFHISKSTFPEWISCKNIRTDRVFELCMQKEATNASVKSANILYWQTLIGLFALLSAVAAAIFSGYAAWQASIGVSVALKVGASGVRPRIKLNIIVNEVEEYNTKDGKGFYKIKYSIFNEGNSEAAVCNVLFIALNILRTKMTFDEIFDTKKDTTENFKKFTNYMDNIIGENLYVYPNKEFTTLEISLDEDFIGKTLEKNEDAAFAIVFEYMDILGTRYKSFFSYRVRFKKDDGEIKKYSVDFQQPLKHQQDLIIEPPRVSMWKK